MQTNKTSKSATDLNVLLFNISRTQCTFKYQKIHLHVGDTCQWPFLTSMSPSLWNRDWVRLTLSESSSHCATSRVLCYETFDQRCNENIPYHYGIVTSSELNFNTAERHHVSIKSCTLYGGLKGTCKEKNCASFKVLLLDQKNLRDRHSGGRVCVCVCLEASFYIMRLTVRARV